MAILLIVIVVKFENVGYGNSLVDQWLGLSIFTARAQGSILVWELKAPQASWCGQKKKQTKHRRNKEHENVDYKNKLSVSFLLFSYVQKDMTPENPICSCTYVSEIWLNFFRDIHFCKSPLLVRLFRWIQRTCQQLWGNRHPKSVHF